MIIMDKSLSTMALLEEHKNKLVGEIGTLSREFDRIQKSHDIRASGALKIIDDKRIELGKEFLKATIAKRAVEDWELMQR